MRLLTKLKKLTLAGGIVASMLAGQAQAEMITLRYSNWLPANYPLHVDVMAPWMAEVERVTEGRVKVESTPKVVGAVANQYDVAADGLADIVMFLPGYNPGRFVFSEGLDLPFQGTDMETRCPASWRAYEKFIAPLGEFEDVQALSLFCSPSGQIGTVNTGVTAADSLKGLKIRAASPAVASALTLLGAAPISKPASELYELLAGGTADGAIFPLDSIVGFKLDGLLKKVTYMPGGFNSSMVLIAMNKEAWAKISDVDQEAIMEVSGEVLAAIAGQKLKISEQKAREALLAGGTEIIASSPELAQQLQEIVQPVTDDWISRAKAAGMANPEEMLLYLRAEISKRRLNPTFLPWS